MIRVEGLAKEYRLGARRARYGSLRESLSQAVSAPLRLFRGGGGLRREIIRALDRVDFQVAPGEVVGIIGRNGAGKSTLLKILSRITDPTEGSIDLYGRVGSLLEVGTGFHPELTGRENIALNGAILGMGRREIARKFDEIVAFSELEKFLDTAVKHYSSGMYMRLAFAVAAHLEPEILIVDEVLAVGDVNFQKKCLGKMGEIGHEGRTVLVVSHNLPIIVNLCDRAILLDEGRVLMDGPSHEVVSRYLAGVQSQGGVRRWPDPGQAPGNERVRLESVSIVQDEIDGPTADVDIAREVRVEITYRALIEGEPFYTGIWLKDQYGAAVLSSGNHKSVSLTPDPWNVRPHPVGLYRSVCRIPGNFLNEGRYSVTAIVGRGMSDTQILADEVISFHVYDSGEMRQEYYGGWIGVVRPRLAWHTESLGQDTAGAERRPSSDLQEMTS